MEMGGDLTSNKEIESKEKNTKQAETRFLLDKLIRKLRCGLNKDKSSLAIGQDVGTNRISDNKR